MTQKISETVSLRALEVLDELARTGSMQEAASKLNMSAPATSQQRFITLILDCTHAPAQPGDSMIANEWSVPSPQPVGAIE
ncbi:helix-turn-helix domain-containing protein [Granulosicoccus antarcticus]|uniref:HTH lysR-type domain-containing protein n=1 Tax=Granulosicoccus antarcticus IMCC3135 TaxID=1192854 RepID=A0A2Z2P1M0_9GAMM|nr:LysR family transcriptional regulator [Granulosicoccus antarcticus]ASJ76118.1 hypothetical protein IMCC3135_30345 [Granulosicoccus antarcticus IMCC3135]